MKGTEMTTAQSSIEDRVQHDLDVAAHESLLFLVKAFRNAVDLEEGENKALLTAASATVSTWGKNRQTNSARIQTSLVLAKVLADDNGGKVSDYLPADLKEPQRMIGAGEEEAAS